jgi:hypothetical protein
MGSATTTEVCPICKRDCPADYLNKHHLRTRKGDKKLIERLCRDCHSTIHRLFTNKELRPEDSPLNTIEGLLAHPEYARAVAFIRTVPPGRRLKIRESNRRKGKRGRRR